MAYVMVQVNSAMPMEASMMVNGVMAQWMDKESYFIQITS
jgi:hypothetical protein